MGMFDTFVGNIECSHCKDIMYFNEQTKNYDCLLQEFKVGDYIDKGNANYFYQFEYPCLHCKEDVTIYAAIRRGQLIGYYTDVTNLDLNSMENIEENYQRNLEYKAMCETGYGFEKCIYEKEKYFHVGDTIHILNRDWIVEAIFEEKVNQNVENERVLVFYNCRFRENKCYRVHDNEGNKRLIITREIEPTYVTGLIGCDSEDPYSKYSEQLGTELIALE